MIIEYPASDFDDLLVTGMMRDTWSRPIGINLAYVTSVQPFLGYAVLVTIVGRSGPIAIKEDFNRFMRSWQAAKR